MRTGKLMVVMALCSVLMAFFSSCGGRTSRASATPSDSSLNTIISDAGNTLSDKVQNNLPVKYTYIIKNTYPHDPSSYTQGLFWYQGCLWEGTGQYGQSAIKKVNPATGKAAETIRLDQKYFGEGIALLDGKIYQLTWHHGEGFIYDATTLNLLGKFGYHGEGWGLTNDEKYLYMSDGTHEIKIVDPANFNICRVIDVKMAGRRVKNINELEWIEGRIWANIYLTDIIIIIDPDTGVVEGMVDMSWLLPKSDILPDTDVLNGIAYDSDRGRIFVTGKNWPKLFEIEIKEK